MDVNIITKLLVTEKPIKTINYDEDFEVTFDLTRTEYELGDIVGIKFEFKQECTNLTYQIKDDVIEGIYMFKNNTITKTDDKIILTMSGKDLAKFKCNKLIDVSVYITTNNSVTTDYFIGYININR